MQQEELAWEDGEELHPAPSNNSLSFDMSFSEGDNTNMFMAPVAVEAFPPREAVPAILPPCLGDCQCTAEHHPSLSVR